MVIKLGTRISEIVSPGLPYGWRCRIDHNRHRLGFSLLLGGLPAVCVAFIAPKWVRDHGKLQLLGDSRSGVIQALAPEMTGLRVVPPGGTLDPYRLGPS